MADIGQVQEQTFHLYRGKTFAFDVVWWLDAAKTQAAVIVSARARIKAGPAGGPTSLVDLAPTVVAPNRVVVRLTPAQTAAIDADTGYLEVEAETATETKPLVRGWVRVYPEVSE